MRISDWSSDVCSSDLIERWRPAGPVMIVNRMIADYPGAATAGASLHEWSVAEWAPRVPVWAPRGAPGVSNVAPATPGWHGSSSLYAAEVAIRLYRAGRVDRKSTRLNSSH